MKLSASYDFSADMGSLASAAQIDTAEAHVEDAVAKGAKVLAGGKRRADLGPFFFEPTVLTDVTDDMACFAGETFGPLVAVHGDRPANGKDAPPFDPTVIVAEFGVPLAGVVFFSVMATNSMAVYGMVTSLVNAEPGRIRPMIPKIVSSLR